LEFLKAKNYTYGDNNLQTYKDLLDSDDPEYAHRIPAFRAALIAQLLPYIKHNPRTENDEKMIAFLFGLISHQEADIPFQCNAPGFQGLLYKVMLQDVREGPWEHPLLEREIDILLFGYDHRAGVGNIVDFSFYSEEFMKVIRAASTSATPSMTPAPPPMICRTILWWTYCTEDKFNTAQQSIIALFGNIIESGKTASPNDEFRDMIVSYEIGGIIDGAELTAAAWAKTWDNLMKDPSPPVTP
jgi:hypothetical protein